MAAVVLATILTKGAAATTWYVSPSGSSDATTIQSGINIAAAGDTVEVECGTYFERNITLKDGIHLRSAMGQASCVTIDAEQLSWVFFGVSVQDASIVGFTVTGGMRPRGGGMYCTSLSEIHVENCVFSGNTAHLGGGVYAHHSPITLENCTFTGNTATFSGGGLLGEDHSHPTITNCTFTDNIAGENGGGAFFYYDSSPAIEGTVFAGNVAGGNGGAIGFVDGAPALTNCSFSGNAAATGAGVGGWGASLGFVGCTVTGNLATQSGGGIFGSLNSTVSLANSILWGNCAPSGHEVYLDEAGSSITFACSDVDTASGGISMTGGITWNDTNFFANPLFCDSRSCVDAPTGAGVYTLSDDSPCAPANTGACGLIGSLGPGGCRTETGVRQSSWGRVKAAYRGGDRR